jgi:hypothetical protein
MTTDILDSTNIAIVHSKTKHAYIAGGINLFILKSMSKEIERFLILEFKVE